MIETLLSKPELFWFLLGLLLFLAELVIPGFFIFFFGLGAWITALVCLVGDPGHINNIQIIIFAVTSVFSLLGLRRLIQKKFFYNKDTVDDYDDEFTGKEALAITDFGPNKTGKIEFKGTTWKAESRTSKVTKGQNVTITGKESIILIVEPK